MGNVCYRTRKAKKQLASVRDTGLEIAPEDTKLLNSRTTADLLRYRKEAEARDDGCIGLVQQTIGARSPVQAFLCCAASWVLLILVSAVAAKILVGSVGSVPLLGLPAAGAALASQQPAEPQTSRLRITNGCADEPMWLAYLGRVMMDPQNLRLEPGAHLDLTVPAGGLETVRYWSKWRCGSDGGACAVGDSGGPGQRCERAAGCSPPIDTKFEAIFGDEGKPCNTAARDYKGCDFVDVSLKDGYTVPFQLEIKGDCRSSYVADADHIHQVVDCQKLSLAKCPTREELGGENKSDLKVVNPAWSTLAGCSSPCSKLVFQEWTADANGTERMVPKSVTKETAPYCCPTPQACPMGGALDRSAYVRAVHQMCPGVNGYAYGRGMGVGTCPAGTRYEMIFYCPELPPPVIDKAKASLRGPKGKAPTPAPPPAEAGAAPPAPSPDGDGSVRVDNPPKAGFATVPALPLGPAPQPTRLRVTNGCDREPIWVAHTADRTPDGKLVRLAPGESYDAPVQGNFSTSRYWAKLGCDDRGQNCAIGENAGPGQGCSSPDACAPPVDTRLQGTFGQDGLACDTTTGQAGGCDFLDVSLVDGYTLPFKFEVFGDCRSRYASRTGELARTLDCSRLALGDCPCDEDLRADTPASLRVAGSGGNTTVGCTSPCSKLAASPSTAAAEALCCSAPPDAEACSTGPAASARYVRAVHESCPGAHSHAHDDGLGLLTCPAGTKYRLTMYCPDLEVPACPAQQPPPPRLAA